jgi:tryptophanyl-tRNA synthetase
MSSPVSAVQTPKAFQPRIFSGIQPSGGLTLGNYLGALKRFVEKQDEGIETIYCLVDMHAITVWQDPPNCASRPAKAPPPSSPPGSTRSAPSCSTSRQVAAHADLAWVFNCVARLGWLDRMTQFKEKSGKHAENGLRSVSTRIPSLHGGGYFALQGDPTCR